MFRKSLPRAFSLTGFKSGGEAYEHFYVSLKKKLAVYFLCIAIAFSGVFYTERKAHSLIVIPLLAGIELVMSTGGAIGLAAVVSVFGTAAWLLNIPKETGGTGVQVRINLKSTQEVPPGWTPNSDPALSPNPPGTITPETVYRIAAAAGGGCAGTGCVSSSWTAVCGQWLGGVSPTPVSTINDGTTCSATFSGGGSASASVTTESQCQAGYTLSGASCVLTTPGDVRFPTDGKCGVNLTSGSFSNDARDPDCDGGAATPYTLTSGGKIITVQKDNGKIVITSQEDNSVKVEQWQGNGNGTSQYTSATFSAPDGSSGTGGTAVTGFNQGTVMGEGALSGDGEGADNGTGKCGAPGQPPCKIDESGTPNGSGAADAAKAAIQAVTPESLGLTPWAGEGVSVFSGLPSMGGSDGCVNPLSWTLLGHEVAPDMCAVWSPLKPWFAWLLWALTAVYIWKRTTGAAEI